MKNHLQKLCFLACVLFSFNAFAQTPKLNSLDTAKAVIFLDFDGQTVQSVAWQYGDVFTCAPSTMNNAQITEIFNRVSEDYRPFAINVTTDSAKYFAAPAMKRLRIIVTPTSAWYPNVGGVTFINSFTWGDNTPGFVFEDKLAFTPKYIAEACTHESGHGVGLSHQSKYDASCQLLESYSTGSGVGETGWAPVMGNSYGKNMTGWNDGPTPYDCAEMQDNLTIITTQNGFGYRPDDFAETLTGAATSVNPIGFNMAGVISTPSDKDAFRFVLSSASTLHLDATPFNLGVNNEGANLDIMLKLYNGSGALIRTYNPLGIMHVTADTALNAGTYYVVVAGAGNSNTSNYGSLGSYSFTGFKGALPIHSVALRGVPVKNAHELSWNIIADEPIASQVLEYSANGFDFSPLASFNGNTNSYVNTPSAGNIAYYRLRATSVINQSMTSNVIAMKSGRNEKAFSVSTLVQQQISVIASDPYTYGLYDINGRQIAAGKKNRGADVIDVQQLPKGMYVLQMMSNNYKQTERIIRE